VSLPRPDLRTTPPTETSAGGVVVPGTAA